MVKGIVSIAIIFAFCSSFGQKYTTELVKTNLSGNVYSPAFCQNKIVVCSDRKNSMGLTFVDGDGQNPVDLFSADSSSLTSFKTFHDRFKSNLHDGPISFTSKGDFCAISKNVFSELKLKKIQSYPNRLGIFFSNRSGSTWFEYTAFPYNDSSYSCTHPALSEDGKTLYFASNMPNGFGGYDIWKSENKKGVWSKPVNMGEEINSDKDDLFPTVIGEQLHFSSNRGVMGGLDIYQVTKNSAVILDESINSSSDDFGMASINNGGSGYFTSNRTGKDQLYSFKSLTPQFNGCSELVQLEFCYTLQEENASILGESDELVYEWDINGVKIEGITIDYCFPGVGEYDIVLNITDKVLKETYYEQARYHISLFEEEQPYITSPNKVVPNTSYMMSAERSNLPGGTIDSYYWQISDGSMYTGKTCEHSFENEGDFKIQLGVVLKSGAKHCVTKTITSTYSEASVVPVKLDESQISNRTANPNIADSSYVYSIEALKSDSIINDYNFRTNLEKYGNVRVKYLEEDEAYMYLVGEFRNIEEAHPIWQELKKDGFADATVKPFTKEELDDFQIDKVFVLENLRFDEGSWKIKPEFQKDLNLIAGILLSNKTLKVRIEAHTDAAGTPEFNMELSQNRAISVKQYLVQIGINKERIEERGFGETKPVGDNKTQEGREQNRRVEFTLLE